jgi:ATP-dependent exoDNAse (exonuclease V) beta subunit
MVSKPRAITGHIDFLQVRNGAVHILDYKPDARTNKPIAQLAIYALALTRLVPGLKLFDIKCSWFNEEEYCEFFPRTLFATPK